MSYPLDASVRSVWSGHARARQHFLPLHTAGLAAVGCAAQSRGCADGGLMLYKATLLCLRIGEISRTVKLHDNRFKAAKQGQKHEVLLK